eukprot:5976068-Amphidinium_carterae.1
MVAAATRYAAEADIFDIFDDTPQAKRARLSASYVDGSAECECKSSTSGVLKAVCKAWMLCSSCTRVQGVTLCLSGERRHHGQHGRNQERLGNRCGLHGPHGGSANCPCTGSCDVVLGCPCSFRSM